MVEFAIKAKLWYNIGIIMGIGVINRGLIKELYYV